MFVLVDEKLGCRASFCFLLTGVNGSPALITVVRLSLCLGAEAPVADFGGHPDLRAGHGQCLILNDDGREEEERAPDPAVYKSPQSTAGM